jgi:hypothetical protein
MCAIILSSLFVALLLHPIDILRALSRRLFRSLPPLFMLVTLVISVGFVSASPRRHLLRSTLPLRLWANSAVEGTLRDKGEQRLSL